MRGTSGLSTVLFNSRNHSIHYGDVVIAQSFTQDLLHVHP